jgi:membrane-associated protease RseP (regulator of RpoE activity)
VTTTAAGLDYYASYEHGLGLRGIELNWALVGHAAVYAAAVLAILGAHEMGHYLACRFYNVDCTLPFFIPFLPVLSVAGTLGAVIRIREPFPNRKALFDIGIAGPIAGFLVLCPLLIFAMQASTIVAAAPPMPNTLYFGEPLLFRALTWLTFGPIGEAYQLNLHPVGFAAWFGMLATAWNLLPFGQFDGGHLTYATIGERSKYISIATVTGAVIMCFVSINWILMAIIMLAMLKMLGARHPPVMNEYEPLGTGRLVLAAFAVLMFALCFTPTPITLAR